MTTPTPQPDEFPNNLQKTIQVQNEKIRRSIITAWIMASLSLLCLLGSVWWNWPTRLSPPTTTYKGKSISQWVGQLNDKDPESRWEAANALAKIGPEAKSATPALIKALQDKGSFQEPGKEQWFELHSPRYLLVEYKQTDSFDANPGEEVVMGPDGLLRTTPKGVLRKDIKYIAHPPDGASVTTIKPKPAWPFPSSHFVRIAAARALVSIVQDDSNLRSQAVVALETTVNTEENVGIRTTFLELLKKLKGAE